VTRRKTIPARIQLILRLNCPGITLPFCAALFCFEPKPARILLRMHNPEAAEEHRNPTWVV
jgi:hypothetical protein